jgi:hypothetical protein
VGALERHVNQTSKNSNKSLSPNSAFTTQNPRSVRGPVMLSGNTIAPERTNIQKRTNLIEAGHFTTIKLDDFLNRLTE